MKLNVIGILFGGVLGASNLHEYDTIHSMLAFEELDVFFVMASAIAVSAPLLLIMERRGIGTPFGGELTLSRYKPVLMGFTTAAATLIIASQLPKVLGTPPADSSVLGTAWNGMEWS